MLESFIMTPKQESPFCHLCNSNKDSKSGSITCHICRLTSHTKCNGFDFLKMEQIVQFPYMICVACFKAAKNLVGQPKELHNKINKLEEDNKKILDGIKALTEKTEECADNTENLLSQLNDSNDERSNEQTGVRKVFSYANAVKRKQKQNSLIIKAKNENPESKPTDKLNEISTALDELKIDKTTPLKDGNLILNFSSIEQRDLALEKMKQVESVKATSSTKRIPRIKIPDVNDLDQAIGDKDEIVSCLIKKTECLSNISDIDKKIELKKIIKRGKTVHYILSCMPEIREILRKNGNEVRLEWEKYQIEDSYYVTRCYHCQGFGHVAEKCYHKNKEYTCNLCAERYTDEHENCRAFEDENYACCTNCKKENKKDTWHYATDPLCPVFQKQIEWLKNITDDGSQ